jgi:dGTPase
MLESYASSPINSRGRLHPEAPTINRNCFQRDRDRILYSQAFRRLEYKTQVFVNSEGDHYRTRLTHSLEVSQIARTIAHRLCLNVDLAEAYALSHDIGHPPFGHAGEEGLNKAMTNYGGFDHNAHALKIVTDLESRYALFPGLNLSWEVLEGLVKHNGPIKNPNEIIKKYNKEHDLELKKFPNLEAQISSLSDDIAYICHDLDDGFRAKIFSLYDLEIFDSVPLVSESFKQTLKCYHTLSARKIIHEAQRRIYADLINDLSNQTKYNLEVNNIQNVEDIRKQKKMMAGFSDVMLGQVKALKDILSEKIYQHHQTRRMCFRGKKIVTELFDFFMEHPDCLEIEQQQEMISKKKVDVAVVVADYIAGMTDRFAVELHNKLFNSQRDSKYF